MKRLLAIVLTLALCLSILPVAQAATYATVVGGWLRLREQPSFSARTITSYYTGTQVTILSTSGKWYQVKTPDNRTGYMHGDYLKISGTPSPSPSGTAGYVTSYNGGAVHMRLGPGTGYGVIATYNVGTPLTILQKGTNWSKISIYGETGYMMNQYISTSYTPSPSPAVGYATIWSSNGYGVRLRTGPGRSYSKIGVYSVGTTVEILSKGAVWDYIRVGSRTGYMMNEFLNYHNANELKSVTLNNMSPVVNDELWIKTLSPSSATVSYQWIVGGAVRGVGSTYKVTTADIGQTIQLKVTGTGNYTGTVKSAVTDPVISSKQINGVTLNTIAPVINDKLIASVSPAGAKVSYAWRVNGNLISTSDTYTVTYADIGYPINLIVTGNNGFTGSASITTMAVSGNAALTAVSLNSTSPSVNDVLTASTSPSIATVNWQWYRTKSSITTAISGATASTYTVTAADEGATLTAYATATGYYTGSASATTNTVKPAPVKPVIVTASVADATLGSAYSATLIATGTSPIEWTVSAGTLPVGLTLVKETGVISGTPTAAGAFSVTFNAANSAGNDKKTLTLNVIDTGTAPVITTTALTDATVGSAYSAALTATGTAPITWAVESGVLPAGITLSTDGVISGTPATAGSSAVTIKAQNIKGSASQAYILNVNAAAVAPAITTATMPDGAVGTAYSQLLTATGTAPITWSFVSGTMPTGLTLSSDGILSGTPSTAGNYTFTVQASNSVGSVTAPISMKITSTSVAPVIISASLPAATEGNAYSAMLLASGTTPIVWTTSSTLPAGITLGTDGTLSGTPTTAGVYPITVTASNGTLPDATSNLTLTVNAAPSFTLTVVEGSGSGSYKSGNIVPITANPAPTGMIFDVWTCSDGTIADTANSTTTFTMPSSNATVTATYKALSTYTLTVVNGYGSGTYVEAQSVSITADPPATGMTFDKWSCSAGSVAVADSVVTTFYMPGSNATVTATYKPLSPTYTLTVVDGSGSGTYSDGDVISITADPAPIGKAFQKWTTTGGSFYDSNAETTSFVMPASNATVTANYVDLSVNYTLSVVDGSGSGSYLSGESVTISADPAPVGKAFEKWTTSGGGSFYSSVSENTTFVMPENNVTVTANYVDTTVYYTLTVNSGSGNGSYTEGSYVSISADPAPIGYHFTKWTTSNGGNFYSSVSENTQFIMPAADVTITANYAPDVKYSLSVSSGSGDGQYLEGESVYISANAPAAHYSFEQWKLNSGSGSFYNSYAADTYFVMNAADAAITATYTEDPKYEVYVAAGDPNGTVNGGGNGYEGESVGILASPAAGYHFKQWDDGNINESRTVSIPGHNITYTAYFEAD